MTDVEARSRGAMDGGDRALIRRRSPRLIRKRELSACASQQDLILMLKREERALREILKEGWAREGLLDEYMAGLQQADTKYPKPQPAAGKTAKRKKKVVIKSSRVPEKLIEYMILNRHRRNSFQGICDDLEVGKRSQWFREKYAERMAIANKYSEYQDALIKQFRAKGYADDYAEVLTDDDDDDEN